MQKGAKFFFAIPATHNAFIYIMDGKINVSGDGEVEAKYVATFNLDGTGFADGKLDFGLFRAAAPGLHHL